MKDFKMRIEEPKLLSEDIAECIKQAIIKGKFAPGERVAEAELAESMGISRTPLREAFRRLENEGFLTIIPRKGAVVARLDPKEAEELYQIKSILEGLAARLAAPRIKEKDIEKLEKLNHELTELVEKNDLETYYKVHARFHEVYVRACGNERLVQMILNLNDHFRRYGIVSLTAPRDYRRFREQHASVIDAFRRKDPDLAELRVKDNVSTGGRVLIDHITAIAGSGRGGGR